MRVTIEDQDVEQQQRDDHADRRRPCPARNGDVDEVVAASAACDHAERHLVTTEKAAQRPTEGSSTAVPCAYETLDPPHQLRRVARLRPQPAVPGSVEH